MANNHDQDGCCGAWEEYGQSRICADCKQPMSPLPKPQSDSNDVKKPLIFDGDVESFNNQMDKIRENLFDSLKQTENLKLIVHRGELINRMEVARRVFNHFVETGKVEIPD